ncbi:MAG: hexose kinase [Nocardioides sp.]
MILCVCLSPAIDVTYHVDRLHVGGTTRVGTVTERPGGKAVNVARVLHRLGERVHLVAPAGGDTGEELQRGLAATGLAATLVPSGHPTRRTVTVVVEGSAEATTLVEPGVLDCWAELLAAVDSALTGAAVLVLSGSVPDGVPPDGLAALVVKGRRLGLPVLVDTDGPQLLAALAAGATVVKPNARELATVTREDDPVRAARSLAETYDALVVASLGEAGVVVASPHGTWEGRPAAALTGNPTGAGDALVAGLARALHRDAAQVVTPEQMLHDAVALSAAAVRSPEAGDVDPSEHVAQLHGTVVRALDGAR